MDAPKEIVLAEAADYRCALPEMPEPTFPPGMHPDRQRALVVLANKWANGTTLHYSFLGTVADAQKEAVRRAFAHWKAVGIGLNFTEVAKPSEAEVRIGFVSGDGSWSYIGTLVLSQPVNARTMNFGWDLTTKYGFDTALHEIGHTLGMPHEHQNPYAGIVWDEEAVYRALGEPPNRWDRNTTYHNIIRKLDSRTVRGSEWDRNSVMHYQFQPGLIKEPAELRNGLTPAGGLSAADKNWARAFYPALSDGDAKPLGVGRSELLPAAAGEQANYLVRPAATRKYRMQTFGTADTQLVLFRRKKNEWAYMTADDDGGDDRNARLEVRLEAGKEYMLRARVKYVGDETPPAVMLW